MANDNEYGFFRDVLLDSNGNLKVNIVSGNTLNYSVYTAQVTQASTSTPTAVILGNDLGTLTYAYDSQGNYTITSSGLFTSAKVAIFIGPGPSNGVIYGWEHTNANVLIIYSLDVAGNKTNNLFNNTSLEIRVYN